MGEVVLYRIAQREKAAAGILQAVPERDQFLPAIDADPPAEAQIARQFFGVDIQIGHVGIAPDERMKRLDIARNGTVLLAPVNLYRPRFAELNRDNRRRRVRAEKQFVFFESHGAQGSATSPCLSCRE